MNEYAKYFGRVVWIGVLANFVVAAFGIFAPGFLMSVLGLGTAVPDFWVRLTAWLLFLLSLFYIPAANAPFHSPVNSWLTVSARWGGVIFVSSVTFSLGLDLRFLVFAFFDLVFAVPELILLSLAYRTRSQEGNINVQI